MTVAAGGDRVLLWSVERKTYLWWDARTGAEAPAPVPPVAGDHYSALSPDGRWLMHVGGGNTNEVWRQPADGSRPAELVYRIPGDRNSPNGTIDDRGNPILTISTWSGELFIVPAPPGQPW